MYVDLPVFLNQQEGFFSLHYTGSDGDFKDSFKVCLSTQPGMEVSHGLSARLCLDPAQ